jgi:hypothetical protein
MPGPARPRRCGICRQPGHDRRKCNNDLTVHGYARRCGICRQPGHDRRKCNNDLARRGYDSNPQHRCHICQQIGHTARNCNSDLAREAQQRAHDLIWTGVEDGATELVGEEEGSISWEYEQGDEALASARDSSDATPDTETKVTESDTCPICMENLEKTNCCITSCGHQFCLECIIKHSNTKSDCPLCRGNLLRTGVREHATLPPAAPTVDILFPVLDTFHTDEIMDSMLNRVNELLLDHAWQPARQVAFAHSHASWAAANEGGGTAAEIDLTVDAGSETEGESDYAGSETEGESDYESESDYVSDILALPAAVQPLFAHLLMGDFESQI